MSDDLVKRLRDTPNWMREGFQDWKDNVRTYDRAPFEAADRIEDLKAKLAECEARLGKAVDVLQWQSDAIRKSISGNEVGRNRVLLNGVYHEGPVVNWVFEILTGFETINLTTLAAVAEPHKLTGGKDE